MKYLAVIVTLTLGACSSNIIDPEKNPEWYKVRKALTLPKETCVKYPTGKTTCM